MTRKLGAAFRNNWSGPHRSNQTIAFDGEKEVFGK